MNKAYKTVWSALRHQYVVVNEKRMSRGKAAKAIVTATAIALSAFAGATSANVNGVIGDAHSWETEEYTNEWGLAAMNASSAYALGFTGKGVMLGEMDSGALSTHPEFGQDGRILYVKMADGKYSSTGNRYPVPGMDSYDNGKYQQGEDFKAPFMRGKYKDKVGELKEITGDFIPYVNDSHGTHVLGTIAAARDGNKMHGVAFDAQVAVGNNGGLDNSNYGPFLDYNFFKAAWQCVAEKQPKFINNSFGTNTRIYVPNPEEDGKLTGVTSLPVDSLAQMEYEYFYFQKDSDRRYEGVEGTSYEDGSHWKGMHKSFVDAGFETIKDQDTIQVFTTGNRNYKNPYYRPNFPYFHPEAESKWVAVSGLMQDKDTKGYKWIDSFNEPGVAKWWTVAAPGRKILSSVVHEGHYVDLDNDHPMSSPGYDYFSGTSMAAPHVTGALGVLAQRYPEMTAQQVRDVMFTTANHRNPDGSLMTGWTAEEGLPDELYGWGVPDLSKGMYGPGQFLGYLDTDGKTFHENMEYNLTDADIWTNDISQKAYNARLAEEEKWVEEVYKPWKEAMDSGDQAKIDAEIAKLFLGDKKIAIHGQEVEWLMIDGEEAKEGEKYGKTAATISKDEAIKYRTAYLEARMDMVKAHQEKTKLGLVKKGDGILVMTGDNSYKGTTTVEGGALLAFNESLGTDNTVTVKNNGTFGVVNHINDTFTLKGELHSKEANSAKVTVKFEGNEGQLYASALDNVTLKKVEGNAKLITDIHGADSTLVAKAYIDALNGKTTQTLGSLAVKEGDLSNIAINENTLPEKDDATPDAENGVQPVMLAAAPIAPATENDKATDGSQDADDDTPDSLVDELFTASGATLSEDKKSIALDVDVKDTPLAELVDAQTANEKALATGLTSGTNTFLGSLLQKDAETAKTIISHVADDALMTSRNQLVESDLDMLHTVTKALSGSQDLQRADLGNGHLWIDTTANHGKLKTVDGDKLKADMNHVAIGGDAVIGGVTLGVWGGYTDSKAHRDGFRVNSDDYHLGMYAKTDVADFTMTGVLAWGHFDRDFTGTFDLKSNAKATSWTLYGEAAYQGLNKTTGGVEPYVGLGYMRTKTDALSGTVNGLAMGFDSETSNLGLATVGARASLPLGSVNDLAWGLKADVGFTQFFGDTTPELTANFGGASAVLEGKELKNQAHVGVGLTATILNRTELSVGYRGTFGNAVTDHGVMGQLKIHF